MLPDLRLVVANDDRPPPTPAQEAYAHARVERCLEILADGKRQLDAAAAAHLARWKATPPRPHTPWVRELMAISFQGWSAPERPVAAADILSSYGCRLVMPAPSGLPMPPLDNWPPSPRYDVEEDPEDWFEEAAE
jgi:hypothetical protein